MKDKSDTKAAVRLWWEHQGNEQALRDALAAQGLCMPEEVIGDLADGFDSSPVERVILALLLIERTGCCTRQGLRQIRDALLGP